MSGRDIRERKRKRNRETTACAAAKRTDKGRDEAIATKRAGASRGVLCGRFQDSMEQGERRTGDVAGADTSGRLSNEIKTLTPAGAKVRRHPIGFDDGCQALSHAAGVPLDGVIRGTAARSGRADGSANRRGKVVVPSCSAQCAVEKKLCYGRLHR